MFQKGPPSSQKLNFYMKKNILFFTQNDHPASQKTEIVHEKMTKKVPKRAHSPAKTEVLHEKNVFFYSERPPSPAKADALHEKKCNFLLKKTIQPPKK